MNTQPNLGHSTSSHPIGQISDISTINDTGVRIGNLLEKTDFELALNSQNNFKQLLTELETEVITTRKIVDFHYKQESYYHSLSLNDDILCDNFDKLLESFPSLASIYNNLLKICDSLPTKDIIIDNIYKIYLEDLLYEFIDTSNLKYTGLESLLLKFESIDEIKNIFSRIKNKNVRRVIIRESTLSKLLANNGEGLKIFLHELNLIGVKSLDFDEVFFEDYFRSAPKEFINFIKQIGEAGIKSLNLYDSSLDRVFGNDDESFMEFIKTAGKSGIREIDIRSNGLHNILNNDNGQMIEFVKVAGESGIKIFNLNNDMFSYYFKDEPTKIIEFIKTAGNSGIKALYLCNNTLYDVFKKDVEFFLHFLKVAGESGIRYLDICNNNLIHVNWGNLSDLLTLLDSKNVTGLKGLDISNNSFEEIFCYNIYDIERQIKDLQNIK